MAQGEAWRWYIGGRGEGGEAACGRGQRGAGRRDAGETELGDRTARRDQNKSCAGESIRDCACCCCCVNTDVVLLHLQRRR